MKTETIDANVRAYLNSVRTHVEDLPPDEREELLEDLEAHLNEVAAEDGDRLEQLLGPPSAYAAELRASAGYGPAEVTRERIADRIARSPAGRAVSEIADTKAYRSLRDFLPELRPGWWVLRGYLAVVVLDALFGTFSSRDLPIPSLSGSRLAGLVIIGAAAWGSVALGRRSQTDRSIAWIGRIASAVVVVFAFSAFEQAAWSHPDVIYEPAPRSEYLSHADGEPIRNLCLYAKDGTPLSDVLVYDGRGRPITNTIPLDSPDDLASAPSNVYPREGEVFDPSSGAMIPYRCPSVIVAERPEPTPINSPPPVGGEQGDQPAPAEAEPAPEQSDAPPDASSEPVTAPPVP